MLVLILRSILQRKNGTLKSLYIYVSVLEILNSAHIPNPNTLVYGKRLLFYGYPGYPEAISLGMMKLPSPKIVINISKKKLYFKGDLKAHKDGETCIHPVTFYIRKIFRRVQIPRVRLPPWTQP